MPEPVDLLAALEQAIGRAREDLRLHVSTNAYDPNDEPPEGDYDEGYEADRAADRMFG